jgi:type III pantothenate kinase
MLLAIDAGNTNIVFAVFDEDQNQVGVWRIHTNSARTAHEYMALLLPLMARDGLNEDNIKNVIISSVVPAANGALESLCSKAFGAQPIFVNSDLLEHKIKINIDSPAQAGADRLVNAVAVCKYYQTPAVVVDFGTATNFDVIGADKSYEGGVISPGINLSIDALYKAAAKLPMVDVARPKKTIGKNTVEAMQSGIYWGYIGLIEGTLKRIEAELGVKPYVIATGGLAPLFADGTNVIDVIDQDLTLKGLLEIYNG